MKGGFYEKGEVALINKKKRHTLKQKTHLSEMKIGNYEKGYSGTYKKEIEYLLERKRDTCQNKRGQLLEVERLYSTPLISGFIDIINSEIFRYNSLLSATCDCWIRNGPSVTDMVLLPDQV